MDVNGKYRLHYIQNIFFKQKITEKKQCLHQVQLNLLNMSLKWRVLKFALQFNLAAICILSAHQRLLFYYKIFLTLKDTQLRSCKIVEKQLLVL